MYVGKALVVFSLGTLICPVFAFPQTSITSIGQVSDKAIPATSEKEVFAEPAFAIFECFPQPVTVAQTADDRRMLDLHAGEAPMAAGRSSGPGIQVSDRKLARPRPRDFNRDVYYRNKLEFSLEGGWHPINVPFPLDIFVGDVYNTYPLKYTLVPIIASLRWQMTDVRGPLILRGNWDLTLSGSVTAIPRGPETRYYSYIMGFRRNFVPRNWRVAPYFDVRLGTGNIDAKGPKGVLYAQGEALTFTMNMGSGVRYNFNPRYSISAGVNFMHISNLDLSEGNGKPRWGYRNYGINVYGPMVGIDIRLRGHPRHSGQ